MDKSEYWNKFLETNKGAKLYTSFAFGNTSDMNKELLNLVLNNKKTATTSLHCLYEIENIMC